MAEQDQVPAQAVETEGEQPNWNEMARMDPTIASMVAGGVPMTRANYLDMEFNGNVPEEWNEEAEMGLPPGLQNFQGVGLSELPAGPMPIAMGQPGQGPKVAPIGEPAANLLQKPTPSEVGKPGGEARSPLVDTPAPGGRFTQQAGWKPTKQQGG